MEVLNLLEKYSACKHHVLYDRIPRSSHRSHPLFCSVVRSASKLQHLLAGRQVSHSTISAHLSIIEGNVKDPISVAKTLSPANITVDIIISGIPHLMWTLVWAGRWSRGTVQGLYRIEVQRQYTTCTQVNAGAIQIRWLSLK